MTSPTIGLWLRKTDDPAVILKTGTLPRLAMRRSIALSLLEGTSVFNHRKA